MRQTITGQSISNIDLIRAPCVLYGVKYIDLVSLWQKGARCESASNYHWPVDLNFLQHAPFFKMAQNPDLRCVFDIGSQHLGCWGQNTSRIQTIKVLRHIVFALCLQAKTVDQADSRWVALNDLNPRYTNMFAEPTSNVSEGSDDPLQPPSSIFVYVFAYPLMLYASVRCTCVICDVVANIAACPLSLHKVCMVSSLLHKVCMVRTVA